MRRKSFFGINFDPKSQPGYEARNRTMSKKLSGGVVLSDAPKDVANLGVSEKDLGPRVNPQYFWNSGTVDQTMPSRILYKKGWKP